MRDIKWLTSETGRIFNPKLSILVLYTEEDYTLEVETVQMSGMAGYS